MPVYAHCMSSEPGGLPQYAYAALSDPPPVTHPEYGQSITDVGSPPVPPIETGPAPVKIVPARWVMGAPGGTGTIAVTFMTRAAAEWVVTQVDPTATWLTFTPTAPQTEDGTVNYTVAPNTDVSGAPRTTTLTINGEVFTCTQAPMPDVPPVTIDPTSATAPDTGGSGAIAVTMTGPGASGTWTVDKDSTATWLSFVPTAPQTTDGAITWTAAGNGSGAARTAHFYINGKTFTIDQPSVAQGIVLDPAEAAVTAAGGTGNIAVTVLPTGSSWQVTGDPDVDWLTFSPTTMQTANGTITWTAAANATGVARTANLLINELFITQQSFVISQDAAAPPDALSIVYDSIPDPLPPSLTSQNYQARRCAEFGNQITFEGTDRVLSAVTIGMVTWGYQTKYPEILTPDWSHPITLNVYAVNVDNSPGALLGSVTQTFAIPWRPEPDTVKCFADKVGLWYADADQACHNGMAFNLTFDFSGQSLTLPDSVIFGIAYNTESGGLVPIGVVGPYDDLNVGFYATNTAGTNPVAPQAYLNSSVAQAYADGGLGGTDTFRLDVGGDTPNIAIKFETVSQPV